MNSAIAVAAAATTASRVRWCICAWCRTRSSNGGEARRSSSAERSVGCGALAISTCGWLVASEMRSLQEDEDRKKTLHWMSLCVERRTSPALVSTSLRGDAWQAEAQQARPAQGTPDDTVASVKFRAKILGLSAVSEQNAALSGGSHDERADAALQDQFDAAAQLQEELARRQESYVRRERQFKVRIGELEAQLSESRARKSREGPLDASMDRIRQMHRSIMESVDLVQERTSKILQEQEKDLLRAFRARLYSVQEELESEKNKTDDGASAWIEKSKQLETEVEWTKELADRLDRLNQSLTRENQRLKTQFTTQENDREFLVKQLVGVKKDNVRLRNEYEALQRDLQQLRDESQLSHPIGGGSLLVSSIALSSASTSALPRMGGSGGGAASTAMSRPNTATGLASTTPGLLDADNRYKEIIKRLKRLLDVERRNLQQVRVAYKAELQSRTELEVVLKECIQDVRAEILHQSQRLPPMSKAVTAAASCASLTSTSNNSSHPTTSANAGLGGGGARRMDSPHSGLRGTSSSTMTTVNSSSGPSDTRLGAAERQRLVDTLLAKEQLLQLLASKAFPMRRGLSGGSGAGGSGAGGADPLFTGVLSADEMARVFAEASTASPGRE
ncbi:hypothetical protein PybrP1_008264 [[Pythium] brassicae (nom. inval.)]|nr:hypothetical protein PybrP1_008264 [[Pythium] brassicae (nom. inval.)]